MAGALRKVCVYLKLILILWGEMCLLYTYIHGVIIIVCVYMHFLFFRITELVTLTYLLNEKGLES